MINRRDLKRAPLTHKSIRRNPPQNCPMRKALISSIWKNFMRLLSTDPEAARQELETYAAKSYQGHPLTEEWVELIFRMGSEGAATVSDIFPFYGNE